MPWAEALSDRPAPAKAKAATASPSSIFLIMLFLPVGGTLSSAAAKGKARTFTSAFSGRDPAAEKRHQRLFQRVRPPRCEDQFRAGVAVAPRGTQQIRDPPRDRGGRVDPV